MMLDGYILESVSSFLSRGIPVTTLFPTWLFFLRMDFLSGCLVVGIWMFICPRSIEFRFRLLFNFTQSDWGFADRQRSIATRLLFCFPFSVLFNVPLSSFVSSGGGQSSYKNCYTIGISERKTEYNLVIWNTKTSNLPNPLFFPFNHVSP